MTIKGKGTRRFRIAPECILLIDNLAIQDLIGIEKFNNQAIICKRNTYFSHAEIFLENVTIPVIFVESEDFENIIDDSIIEINTNCRTVTNMDNTFSFSSSLHLDKSEVINAKSSIVETSDGIAISIELGLRNPNSLTLIENSVIDKVSIIHTETIDFKTASYEEQFSKYKKICKKLKNKYLSFRLFDFSEDKLFNWTPIKMNEITSFGLRGYRLYDWDKIDELVKNQVKALDELSKFYKINIIIPYLSSSNDFENAKRKIYSYSDCERINIIPMLETVSSFYESDFISNSTESIIIGTNDLLQSFFAANRNEIQNSDYLNPYKIGLIRFFKFIADQNINFKICGNLTLLDYYLSILIGLGFKSFIVPDKYYDSIIEKVNKIDFKESEYLANKLLKSNDSEIFEILKSAAPNNI